MNSTVGSSRERREAVLRAAFRGWGKSYYSNTSMATVAEELGVSKAALYRHVDGKADLVEAMEALYLEAFVSLVVEPLEREAPRGLQRFVKSYFERLLDFYGGQPEYYVFLVAHVLREEILAKEPFRRVVAWHQRLLEERLQAERVLEVEEVGRYLTLFGIFWLIEVHRREGEEAAACYQFLGLDLPESSKERGRLVAGAADVCINGFVRGPRISEEEMARVERLAWVEREEMLEPDRIFSAIEQVVAEEGLAEATVEKIARRIGMTKSSLYFYFRNKDDMFGKAVEREKGHLSRLIEGRIRFLDGTSEKLYALKVMAASYTVNNPTQLTVINWLRYRNVRVQAPRRVLDRMQEALEFIPAARSRGDIKAPRGSVGAVALFPNFLVTREILSGGMTRFSREELVAALRRLYLLFEQGVAAYTE